MQTVEVESSGSDESMLGRFQGCLQVDTLVVSSCSQTAVCYWPFCILRNTKVIKLSCLSTVKAIYHDRNWICEMLVVWLCLGIWGHGLHRRHTCELCQKLMVLIATVSVPNIESRKVSYTQIIPNPWMLKMNNLDHGGIWFSRFWSCVTSWTLRRKDSRQTRQTSYIIKFVSAIPAFTCYFELFSCTFWCFRNIWSYIIIYIYRLICTICIP